MQPPSSPLRRQRNWDGPCRAQGGCNQTQPPGAFRLHAVFGTWPRLRSPHSSLLLTQQNKLFQGKVVPLEKMFLHALEALALHVHKDLPDRAWAPPCTSILFKVCILQSHKR